jgi:hypothetical protein
MTEECENMCSICFGECKGISCPDCSEIACEDCVKSHLLSCGEEPKCFACDNIWSLLFIYQRFNTKFINKWINVKKKFLLDYQKNMIRDKMDEAQIRKKENINQEKINSLEITKQELQDKIKKYSLKAITKPKYKQKVEQLRNEVSIIQYEIDCTKNPMLKYGSKYKLKLGETVEEALEKERKKKAEKEKGKFKYACPFEGCRGFLDSDMHCALCDKFTCEACMQPITGKLESHKCKKEDIESANLLKTDSKPCPNCSSLIFRIAGCDFMYCPQCHANFNWVSGHIYMVKARVSADPHAKFVQEEEKQHHERQIKVVKKSILDSLDEKIVLKMAPIHHFMKVDLFNKIKKYKEFLDGFNDSKYINELRIKYLINEIDDEQFKNRLFVQYKKRYVIEQSMEICTKYIRQINKIWVAFTLPSQADEVYEKAEEIREVFNTEIDALSKIMNVKGFVITKGWKFA